MYRVYEESPHYKSHVDGVEMLAVLAKSDDDIDELLDSIDMTVDWPDVLLERLEGALRRVDGAVGMLVKVEVDESCRGLGKGSGALDEYVKDIGSQSAVDMLFARVDNEQSTGIDILDFYVSKGFVPVHKCDGSLLMVNKGYREVFLDALLPRREASLESSGYEP
tara:strand:+ start:454 stop:948 length:495 start_codon:yes stop_codon:yes gene_type:complete